MIKPTARGVGADQRDFVGQGRVMQRDADAVIVRAHIERVLVGERDVDGRSRRGALGEGGNPGLAAAGRVAHHVAENRGQHGVAMLLLAGKPDDRGLAVAHRFARGEQADRQRADLARDRLARLRQRRQILDVAAGERILHNRHHCGLAQRRIGAAAGLAAHFVDKAQYPLDVHFHSIFWAFTLRLGRVPPAEWLL